MISSRLAFTLAALALATGCGDDDKGDGAEAPKDDAAPTRALAANTPPGKITCGDLGDEGSIKATRRATFTLADRALKRNPQLSEVSNRAQLAQRIFVGMTELCKTNGASFRPAQDAVEGVEAGKHQLASPPGKSVGE